MGDKMVTKEAGVLGVHNSGASRTVLAPDLGLKRQYTKRDGFHKMVQGKMRLELRTPEPSTAPKSPQKL
eukprot:1698596-Amphidinium_carterae.1